MDDIRYPQIGDTIEMWFPRNENERIGKIINIEPNEDGGPTLYWVNFQSRFSSISYAVEKSEFAIKTS